jgi:hypothetical protein
VIRKKKPSKYQDEEIPIMREARTQTFKSEINDVSINKRCQFLENIVPINETSEQKPN